MMIDPLESALIGPLLLGLDGIEDAVAATEATGLTPEHFTSSACREAWVQARQWMGEGAYTPDKLFEFALKNSAFGLEVVDRSLWIHDVNLRGNHLSMPTNALAIIERHLRHQTQEAIAGASQGTANEILDQVEASLASLRSKALKTHLNEKEEACRDLHEELNSIERGEQLTQTGVRVWDTTLRGLPHSQLIVIAGRPGGGKTSLMEEVNDCLVRKGEPVLYIQRELARTRAIGRLACRKARVPWSKVENRTLTKDELGRLREEVSVYEKLPLYLAPISKCNAATLTPLIRLHAKQHGVRLVVLDYLQLIDVPSKTEKRIAIGDVAHALKLAANETKCTIVAISQLDRGLDRTCSKPTMADLRESGDIEQNADMILALWLKKETEDGASRWPVNWSMLKNRNGGRGTAEFMFDGPSMSFLGVVTPQK